MFKDKFLEKTRKEWNEIFSKLETCVNPVLELEELSKDKYANERGIFKVKNPNKNSLDFEFQPAPKLSNHNYKEILEKKNPLGNSDHTLEILNEFNVEKETIKYVLEKHPKF